MLRRRIIAAWGAWTGSTDRCTHTAAMLNDLADVAEVICYSTCARTPRVYVDMNTDQLIEGINMTTTTTRNKRTAADTVYSAASVERALDHHVATGRLKDWARSGERYVIDFNGSPNGSPAEVLTLREALSMIHGLASASRAK